MKLNTLYIIFKSTVVVIIVIILVFLQISCLSKSENKKIKENKDLYDTLLLYNFKETRKSDINFSKLSEYFGLKCKKIDILNTPC